MNCPRCKKTRSRELKFYFKKERVELVAQICQVCDFLYAEDEALLKAARKHLKWLGLQNIPEDEKTSEKKSQHTKSSRAKSLKT